MFKKFLQETDSEAEWFELFVCSGECFNCVTSTPPAPFPLSSYSIHLPLLSLIIFSYFCQVEMATVSASCGFVRVKGNLHVKCLV